MEKRRREDRERHLPSAVREASAGLGTSGSLDGVSLMRKRRVWEEAASAWCKGRPWLLSRSERATVLARRGTAGGTRKCG